MANKYTTLNSLFTAIADSIRAKKNGTGTIVANMFPDEINSLKSGFDYENHMATSIADYEFKNCEDLLSVNCYNLTSVGANAFENCTNLKSVILWDSVENVVENAFKGCSSDLIIYCMFDAQPETWSENWNPDGCTVVWCCVETWDVSATEEDNVIAKLYNDVEHDGKYLLVIDGNGNMANYKYNTMPWYNYNLNITSITIPDSITSIGNYAFYKCTKFTSINIPDSVTSIGNSAFNGCTSLTSITIPDGVTSIGSSAFWNCTSLASITIPDSVTSICDSAFINTAYYNNPSSWENDVLYIDNHLIKANSTLSGEYVIKDETLTIAYNVFSGCTSLTSIVVPNSVTSIGNYAFYNCKSLASITYTGTIAQWNAITFGANWNSNTGAYTIHCIDGDIVKS